MLYVRSLRLGRTFLGFCAFALIISLVFANTPVSAKAQPKSPERILGPICAKSLKPTKAELASTTGISKNSVTVGNISILTGPVPGLFQGAPYGAEAYFAYLNSKGGVNGRKIKLVSYDDGFSGQANAEQYRQSIAKQFAVVGSMSLFDNYGCKLLASSPAFSDISLTLDPTTNALPNVFSPNPTAQSSPIGPLAYIKKHYPKAKNVSALISDAETAKLQWSGQKAAFVHNGFKIAYERFINPLETNFTSDVVGMRNHKVNIAYLSDGSWQIEAAQVKEFAQQGFHPTVMITNGSAYSSQFLEATKQRANGMYVAQAAALYLGEDAKTVPAVKTFDAWVARTHPGFKPDLFTVFGWASAQLFAQALAKTGKHPTRGALLAQLKKVKVFDASGLIAPSNPAEKIPPNCYLLAQVRKGKFVRIAPKHGWLCGEASFGIHGLLPKVQPPRSK